MAQCNKEDRNPKNQGEMLDIKNTETEMNVFDGIISRLETVAGGIYELEDTSKETFKAEKQREKIKHGKTEQNVQGVWSNYKNCKMHIMAITGEEREKSTEEIFETTVIENSPQLISNNKS